MSIEEMREQIQYLNVVIGREWCFGSDSVLLCALFGISCICRLLR
jgi:hypothetical protein